MQKISAISIVIFLSLSIISFGQHPDPGPVNKLLLFMNTYQTDSLENLISDSFKFTRTYSTYTNNKRSFLDKYIIESRNLHATYQPLSATTTEQTTDLLVEDHSDYLKYLHINSPEWKMQVAVNTQKKIERISMDTTEGYNAYSKQIRIKSEAFQNWLKKHYPAETVDSLYTHTGALTKRLKEYAGE